MTVSNLFRSAVPLAFVGLFAALPVDAAIISTFDHNGSGFASGTGADAYVNENAPGSRYGGAVEVQMRNVPDPGGTSGQFQMPYYRFDLSAIEKSQALSAKLQVYDYRYGGSGQLDNQNIQVWALNNESLDGWAETGATTGINWTSAPGRTDNGVAFDGPDFNSDATLLGTFKFTRAGTTPWSLPFEVSGLVDLVRNDTNNQLTLMFVGPTSGTLFRTGSKESIRTSLWIEDPIPTGSAATRLHVETNTTIISTYDHNGDGFASGNGADTYITENVPSQNYGTLSNFQFRDQPGASGQQQVGYVRFDISAFGGKVPVEAQLQLYDYRFDETAKLDGRVLTIWGLQNGPLDGWAESGTGGITWEAAPGHADDGIAFNGPDFNSDAVLLGNVTFASQESTNGWSIPLDVPGLAEFIAADTTGLVTLMITASSPGTLFYAGSKESASTSRTSGVAIPLGTIAPRLLLTVPEPGSWSLLLVSAMALAGFRFPRRRGQSLVR